MSYEQHKNEQGGSLDSVKDDVQSALHSAAQKTQEAADYLRKHDNSDLSHYVAELAQGVDSFAKNIKNKNFNELVQDVESLARRNPGLFIAGSIAVGLAISRFAKASASRHHSGNHYSPRQRSAQDSYESVDDSSYDSQREARREKESRHNFSDDASDNRRDSRSYLSVESEYIEEDFADAPLKGYRSADEHALDELSFDDDLDEYQRAQQREADRGSIRHASSPNLKPNPNNDVLNGGNRYE